MQKSGHQLPPFRLRSAAVARASGCQELYDRLGSSRSAHFSAMSISPSCSDSSTTSPSRQCDRSMPFTISANLAVRRTSMRAVLVVVTRQDSVTRPLGRQNVAFCARYPRRIASRAPQLQLTQISAMPLELDKSSRAHTVLSGGSPPSRADTYRCAKVKSASGRYFVRPQKLLDSLHFQFPALLGVRHMPCSTASRASHVYGVPAGFPDEPARHVEVGALTLLSQRTSALTI